MRSIAKVILVSALVHFIHATTIDPQIQSILSNIRSDATSETQRTAALDVIKRITPNAAHLFDISIDVTRQSNEFLIIKTKTDDVVRIEATSGVSACKAFNYYLKYYCNSHVSWDEMRITLPASLPEVNETIVSPSQIVYYQNVCTWSYSFVWWQWADWQRHIDWIALNGITLTLAPMQELVWERVYRQLGMTETEIDDHFAGPAFFAWQRMGNLRGWAGPLTQHFKLGSSTLQKQIIETLRNLGIAVALPAFAGHVPVAFKRIFSNASFETVQRWNRFPDEFCCPLFIDPIDPLFKQIGKLFLTEITKTYGQNNHIYFSDPFNEVNPSEWTVDYLGNVSQQIYATMRSVDANAIWLLQGWMFVHSKSSWTNELIKAFLTAVPKGRILVLDLQADKFPRYIGTSSFYGQPFIWCMLHNFGGTLGMHGSFDGVNEGIAKARKSTNSSMVGIGITPEGIFQNYVIYEFALEQAWNRHPINIERWLGQYALSRYGMDNRHLNKAWQKLQATVYSYNGIEHLNGKYIVCRRPSINLYPLSWYNLTIMDEILDEFLQVPVELANENRPFQHDLVDITRQFIQNKLDMLYSRIIAAFQARNQTKMELLQKEFEALLIDLDDVLHSNGNFLLGKWLESAKTLATNAVERQLFEFQARNQITTWGPNGQIVDYAVKQWSGMVKDYCLPRWLLFFEQINYAVAKNKGRFSDSKCRKKIFKEIEEPFGIARHEYGTQPSGNTYELAHMIFQKWKGIH